MSLRLVLFTIGLLRLVAGNIVQPSSATMSIKKSTLTKNHTIDYSPYLELMLCPREDQMWKCIREKSVRVLDLWNGSLDVKWREFKEEANKEFENANKARGYSSSVGQRPSTIMDHLRHGAVEVKDFIESAADELMGRDDFIELGDDESGESNEFDYDYDNESGEDNGEGSVISSTKKKKPQIEHHHHQQQPQYATPILLQSHPVEWEDHEHPTFVELADTHSHKLKHKKRHRHGHKHGIKFPSIHKFTRGKKKKKKKAIMKMVLIGAAIKTKIELLLKLLSAHLQIKFFAIAFLGLLLNIGRFFMEFKRGNQPHKVIYYEHAQHQHHYEDRDDWDNHGGYWRRSLNVPSTNSYTDELSLRNVEDSYADQSRHDPQRYAYYRQVPKFN